MTRYIFRLGLLFFALQVAVALAYSSDNLVAAQVLGASAVTQYAVPFKLFSISAAIISVLLTPLWPAYGEAISTGDLAWTKLMLYRSMRFAVAFSGAAAVLTVAFGKRLLHLWAGPEIQPSWLLLIGLGAWTILGSLGTSLAMFLNGANLMGFQATVGIVMAVVNLGLSIVLAQHWGVAGIIWGTVIAYSVCVVGPMLAWIPRLVADLERRRKHREVATCEVTLEGNAL